jgi:hypothetical protein
MSLKISFIIIALAICSCSIKNNEYDSICDFVEQETTIASLDSIAWIAFISERGCIGCNKSFAKLMEQQINKEKGLIFLMGNGSIVDISKFTAKGVSNVNFVTEESVPNELVQGDKSSILFLQNEMIDTSYIITSDRLEQKLKMISSRMEE